jgi:prophage regulatory protein
MAEFLQAANKRREAATETRILRLQQLKERTGLSRSTLYSLIKVGQFPAPIQLGARAVGWLSTDVESWIASRIKASKAR